MPLKHSRFCIINTQKSRVLTSAVIFYANLLAIPWTWFLYIISRLTSCINFLVDCTRVMLDTYTHSFETRSGRSTQDRADLGLEPGWVEEKIEEEKIWCDLFDLKVNLVARLTRLQPVNFCVFFLLKQHRFDLKKLI